MNPKIVTLREHRPGRNAPASERPSGRSTPHVPAERKARPGSAPQRRTEVMTMGSGGARARSGPAPDPNALRRERDVGEWSELPAEGFQGATPDWPLSEQTIREAELWAQLWQKPQALMWERYGQELEVALYVRRFAEAESIESKVNLSTLVRQMADSLGLTTPGLRANRWRIKRAEESAEQPSSGGAAPAGARKSSRSRLTVVPAADGE